MADKRLLLVTGLAVLGATLGILTFQKLRTTRAVTATRPIRANPSEIMKAGDSAAARDSVERVIETVPGLAERIAGLSPRQRILLDDSIVNWFATYLQEDFSDVAEGMLSLGIQPEPTWLQDLPGLQPMWARRHATLAAAHFYADQMSLVRVRPGEVMQNIIPIGQKQFESRRDSGRPFLDDLPERDRLMIELVMPGRFIDEKGATMDAEYAIEFTWNPAASQWVPTAYRGYGFPTGAAFEGAIP